MNVFVINHCSTNKGDKAVLEFVVRQLIANGVDEISVSANEPACCSLDHFSGAKLRCVPWGWNDTRRRDDGLVTRVAHRIRREFYPRSYAHVRSLLIRDRAPSYLPFCCNASFWEALQAADLVISTGGHHITSILAPEAISPQTFEMALALLAGKKLVIWSQSIGPFVFEDDDNRRFIQKILHDAADVFIRDHRSLAEMERMALPGGRPPHQTFESVFGLGGAVEPFAPASSRPPVVGISIYSAQSRTPEENDAYVRTFRELIGHAVGQGFRVKFFPMQVKDEIADDRVTIREIVDGSEHRAACSVYENDHDMISHIKELSRCRVFIGHKTHSVIFSLISATPLVAIAYHPKTVDFMEQFGIRENCLEDSALNGAALIRCFDQVVARGDELSRLQMDQSLVLRERVVGDFRAVLQKHRAA